MVRVEPQTLRTKAAEIGAELPHLKVMPQPADGTKIASDAVSQLVASRHKLLAYRNSGQREAKRLSESYTAAAKAYETVDSETTDALARGETAPKIAPVPVNTHHLSPPIPVPDDLAPMNAPTASFTRVEEFAAQLEVDNVGSLHDFAGELKDFVTSLHQRADEFNSSGTVWDGQAAERAEAALTEYSGWLNHFAASANPLIDNANSLAEAHTTAKGNHPTLDECNRAIETRQIKAYAALQARSDEVQAAYAQHATIRAIDPPKPPSGAPNLGPVSRNDPKGAGTPGTPGTTPPAGGGGGAPPGGQPETAPVSPMSAEQPKSGAQPSSGGSPSGGSPSGGSPSGGSGSGGGMPSLPGGDPSKDMPSLPDGPDLSPAAAGSGGGGSGGGGSGGGGAGAMPLQPAASGPALGTSPAAGGMAGHPAAASAGGGMAGGMGGGGMPMGGHGQGGGGKEKRRTPGLTPDEVIYTEDREWTEAYIGQQAKRRTSADGKDTK